MEKYGFKSPPALYYWCKKFLDAGLLRRIDTWPVTYSLTPKGRAIIKKAVIPSEGGKEIWRFHHCIRGYRVLDWGSFKFDEHNLVPMRRWSYARFEVKVDPYEKIVVHVQEPTKNKPGLIKVFIPEIYGSDTDRIFETAIEISNKAVHEIIDRYGMKVGTGYTVRKGHWALVDSQKLARILRIAPDPRVWVDESEGTEEVETREPEHVKSLLDMPSELSELKSLIVEELNPAIKMLTEQLKLHLEVMRKIKENLEEQTKFFKRFFERLS